jgi:hypothetical protein
LLTQLDWPRFSLSDNAHPYRGRPKVIAAIAAIVVRKKVLNFLDPYLPPDKRV